MVKPRTAHDRAGLSQPKLLVSFGVYEDSLLRPQTLEVFVSFDSQIFLISERFIFHHVSLFVLAARKPGARCQVGQPLPSVTTTSLSQ